MDPRFRRFCTAILSAIGMIATIAILIIAGTTLSARAQTDAAAAEAAARTQGRAVAARVARRDAAALFGRFTPEMAQAVPMSALTSVLEQTITTETPLGERVSETVTSQNGAEVYTAEHRWTSGKRLVLTVTLVGAGADRIAGLLLKPADANDETAAAADAASAGQGTQGTAAVIAAGRSVTTLIASRDAAALFRRFTPRMAAAVPQSRLTELLQGVSSAAAPLGKRLQERVTPGPSGDLVTYVGECAWRGDGRLTITVTFLKGSGGRIAGLRLKTTPPKTLPPDPRADYRLHATLHLPFAPGDVWTVVWGGDTREQNYHVDYPDQRHAYDILIQKDGRSHTGDGSRPEQYYAWGKEILAPSPGTVIEAVDGLPDNTPGVMDPAHATGNHVLLDLGSGEYAVLAHLQHGSVRVQKGDHVIAGQLLGLCGNSGNTSEPHLHFHVQDRPYLFRDAVGLPAMFVDCLRNGKRVRRAAPVQGDRIAAVGSAGASLGG